MTVHIVFATCGEYSDRMEWMVAAYTDETMAKTHATLANTWSKEHGSDWYRAPYTNRLVCPFDEHYRADYTGGADYSVASLAVLNEIPGHKVQA